MNMKQFLLDTVKKHHTTLIICTHDVSLVNDVCERIAVFHKGVLKEYNDLNLLKNAPSNQGYRLAVQKSEDIERKLRCAGIEYHVQEEEAFSFIAEDLNIVMAFLPPNSIITVEKFGKTVEDIMVESVRRDAEC